MLVKVCSSCELRHQIYVLFVVEVKGRYVEVAVCVEVDCKFYVVPKCDKVSHRDSFWLWKRRGTPILIWTYVFFTVRSLVIVRKHIPVVAIQIHSNIFCVACCLRWIEMAIFSDKTQTFCLFENLPNRLITVLVYDWHHKNGYLL